MLRRTVRFTVRMTTEEFGKMTDFANRQHMIPSQAMRTLIARGMAENHERKGAGERSARINEGKSLS